MCKTIVVVLFRSKKSLMFLSFLFSCHVLCPCSLLCCWQCEEDGQVFFSLDDGATKFTDLIQLVEFYQLNRGVLPCKLRHPCTVVALWHIQIIWPHDSYHLTWLCLKQTKQQKSFSWLVLFLFLSLQEAGELTDVPLSFYIAVSLPETADLLESFCMDVFEESDAQLAIQVPQSRRERKWTLPFESMLLQNLPQSCYR